MKYREFRHQVTEHLLEFGLHADLAVELLCMICAHESLGGKFRRQMGDGPARSVYQVEKIAHDDVWSRSRSIHANALKLGIKPDWLKMEHDDRYATFVARHIIMLDPRPLPKTPEEMSRWCKERWNKGGKATAEKYLNDYLRWKNEL